MVVAMLAFGTRRMYELELSPSAFQLVRTGLFVV